MPETSYARRVLVTLGLVSLVVVGLLFLWQVSDILLLVFAGILFGVVLLSVANLLRRITPLGRRWSFALTLVLLVAFLTGAGWFIGPQLANQMSELTGQISQPIQSLEERLSRYSWGRWLLQQAPLLQLPAGEQGADQTGQQPPQAENGAPQPPAGGGEAQPAAPPADGQAQDQPQQPQGQAQNQGQGQGQAQSQGQGGLPIPAEQVVSGVTGVASALLTFLADALLVIFIGVFLAANPKLYYEGVVRLFPHPRRTRVREVLDELFRTLQGWLIGQLIAMLVIGVLTGLGLWILGMPLVLALAFLAFLLEFIPLLGPWLSALPALLIALTQGASQALWVALLYLVIQQLESNIIFPIIEQRTVSLPPALTLVAVFVMAGLFGLVGVFVAAPLLAVVMVLVKMLYVHDTLGDRVEVPGGRVEA